MVNKRFVKNAGVNMRVQLTPVGSIGFLSMARQMLDRDSDKQTHFKTWGKAALVSGVDWDLVGNRIYLLAIETGTPSAQVRVQVSFDGVVQLDQTTSQGSDEALALVRFTTRPEN